jgi:carbamoyl-phosphate synthase large subunit
MNIIALSVSRKVQLIGSIKDACKASSRKLFCADASDESAALYFADDFVITPKINSNNLLAYLLNYCRRNNITFILPTSDHDMVFLTNVRKELQDNGITVLMSDSDTINNCISKFKFLEICNANNIPIPTVYKSIKAIEYPCVAKLDVSQASKGVFFIKKYKDLKNLLKKYDFSELIFQKFIDSQEYTIDSFYGENGKLVCAVPRKRIRVVDGESIISETAFVPELIDLADQLASIFDFFGHITIQAFFDGTKVNVIEINPRFGGASNLSFKAGLKSPEWMLYLIDKKYDLIYADNIKYNLKMLRYSQDFFHEI